MLDGKLKIAEFLMRIFERNCLSTLSRSQVYFLRIPWRKHQSGSLVLKSMYVQVNSIFFE